MYNLESFFVVLEDCLLSQWSSWDECNRACGLGTQTRYRKVIIKASNGGQRCERGRYEDKDCLIQACQDNPGIVFPGMSGYRESMVYFINRNVAIHYLAIMYLLYFFVNSKIDRVVHFIREISLV